MNEQV
jgi:hypothetical protein